MPSPSSPPSSKRERLSRIVSCLRSNRIAGSPLLVQTGFPTSLADLVVKNRSKLFKQRNKSSELENIEQIQKVGDDRVSGGLVGESPDVIEREVEVSGVEKRRGGLGFWWVKVAVLGVLTVGGKWVVVGIIILAFGLAGLEFFGVLKPSSKERDVVDIINDDQLEIGKGGFNLRGRELVSPIRETESIFSPSDWKRDVLLERRDFYAVDNLGMNQDTGIACKSKRRKLLRKLFRRKNRKKKDMEEPNSRLDNSAISHEEALIESQEISDEEYFSFEDTDEVIEIKMVDVVVIRDNRGDNGSGKWRKNAFFVVILLGLLGGKGLALILTVACYLLSVCTGTVWKKWKIR